jgi:hypothetical protein
MYKSGNIKTQENYRSISLLNTGNDTYASIIKHKLTKYYKDKTEEGQNEFHKRRSSCDGHFYLRLITEERQRILYRNPSDIRLLQGSFHKFNI